LNDSYESVFTNSSEKDDREAQNPPLRI
jgi:hypothetical protein